MKYSALGAVALAACIAVGVPGSASAQTAEEFYRGNTIHLLIGTSPGGGQDTQARLIARYLTQYIPGNPTVVAQNMPGGGQRLAVEYLYNIAPKDGTYIGQVHPSLPMWQVVEDSVEAEATEFQWIGSPGPIIGVVGAWHTTGVETIEDARATEFTTGSSGVGTFPDVAVTVLNEVLGTRMRIIRGYGGSAEQDLAMERGELQGRYHNWATVRGLQPHWLEEGLYKVFVQMGGLHPELPDVPVLIELAETEEDRQVIDLLVESSHSLGRPYAFAPGVPDYLVDAVREAFMAVMNDPDFVAEAAALEMEIDPFTGDEVAAMMARIIETPEHVVERARGIIEEE